MLSAVAVKTSLKKPRTFENKPAPWEKTLKKAELMAERSMKASWQPAARGGPGGKVQQGNELKGIYRGLNHKCHLGSGIWEAE